MKKNKYKYSIVIQVKTSFAWEYVSSYETNSKYKPTELLSNDLAKYKLTKLTIRTIRRKELNIDENK